MKLKTSQLLLFWLLAIAVSISSCSFHDDDILIDVPESPKTVDGYAPVYGDKSKSKVIQSVTPIPIEDGGKIYIKGNMLFQVETGKGIHVLDVTDKKNPQKLYFIEVMGAQELAIKNNSLYTNNLNDLIVIDISNLADVKVVDRTPNVFELVDPSTPPGTGFYECVDPSKGDVIGWELKTLHYPKCSR